MKTLLFKFNSYEEYVLAQKTAARKTKQITPRNERKREIIQKTIEELELKIDSILCVGARERSEVDFFQNIGYSTIGIDLYRNDNILECDMSKIPDHPNFQNKIFSAVISIDSIEHCLDLEGFKRGLDKVCSRYFICLSRFRTKPSNWDVAVYPFIQEKNFEAGLNYCFPHFQTIYLTPAVNEKDGFLFILKKLPQFIYMM